MKTSDVENVIVASKDVAKTVMSVKSATSKTSAMRLTKDQVFQFPLIMDADINDDEKFPMIKSIEKNYAAIMMTAIVNEGVIDRDKYDNINEFLRRFHNNSDLPFNALESEIEVTEAVAYEGYMPNNELVDMWDCVEEQLDSESINNMYLPYQRTAAKLTRAVEAAKLSIATEAEYFKRVEYKRDKAGNLLKDNAGNKIIATGRDGLPQYQFIEAPSSPSAYNKLVVDYGSPKTMSEWEKDADIAEWNKKKRELQTSASINATRDAKREKFEIARDDKKAKLDAEKDLKRAISDSKGKVHGEIVKDDKYNSLTPTILRMNLANYKKSTAWSQELIIGVRAMPRLLPQSIMISNMVEAFKDRIIFKFIKYTRGEIKWADLLFGINTAREDASMKAERRWLKVLRKRAKKDKGFRLTGHKLNPNCTIIITESDAHMIQEKCGVNPKDVTNVRKMMDKYFLLGFGIYDTEAKMLNIIYDGETEFTTYSMRSMIADSKKEANLLTMGKY